MPRIGLLLLFLLPWTGLQAAPPLLVIALDGFRHDSLERAPALVELAREGARAERMIPVFPSTTFPNFHSMATGLRPRGHGLAGMQFIDPPTGRRFDYMKNAREASWYGGVPFWQIAEDAGIRTAAFFWVATEAGVNGRFPTDFRNYDSAVSHEERIQTAVDWLKQGFGLVMVYFSDVDSAGHRHGPDSPEVAAAIAKVNESVKQLAQFSLMARPDLNILIVSDHGMSRVEGVVDLSAEAGFTGCRSANEGPFTRIYCRDKSRVDAIEEQLKRSRKASLTFRRGEGREGDLLILPTRPLITNVSVPGDDAPTVPPLKGMHGYDPESNPEMHGILIGYGPAFRAGAKIAAARNEDVFAAVLKALGLPTPNGVDAQFSRVRALFREP